MGAAIGEILPLAIGIAISPIPIIAVILMLFTKRAASNGPAFGVGWVVGLLVVVVVALAVAQPADAGTDETSSDVVSWVKLVSGVLLVLLAYRGWRRRPRPGDQVNEPAWMSAIDSFSPLRAAGLGVVLSAANPKNLLLAVSGAGAIAQGNLSGGETVVTVAIFVVLASISIAGPVAIYLVGGSGVQKMLEGWRVWLEANNATVMTVLLLVIGVVLIGKGISGLAA